MPDLILNSPSQNIELSCLVYSIITSFTILSHAVKIYFSLFFQTIIKRHMCSRNERENLLPKRLHLSLSAWNKNNSFD